MNWTETELQWDPIWYSLFDHASQTGGEGLAWMFVKMISDRIHGQWRITGNGGRVSDLSVVQSRENWLFAMRARLGVVDGWLRQNGGRPYSKYLFEALSNPVLMTISPKRRLWNLEFDEDVQLFYERLVDVLNLPVSSEWLQSIDSLLQVSIFSDAGAQRVDDIQNAISQASKREHKRWSQSDPVALQTVLRHAQNKTF